MYRTILTGVTVMPRKGYSVVTVPDALKEALRNEAEVRGVSVPDLIQELIDMKRGLRVPFHACMHEATSTRRMSCRFSVQPPDQLIMQ